VPAIKEKGEEEKVGEAERQMDWTTELGVNKAAVGIIKRSPKKRKLGQLPVKGKGGEGKYSKKWNGEGVEEQAKQKEGKGTRGETEISLVG